MSRTSPGTALLLSPHLDDVAFSCGGIAATLAAAGWTVRVATCFTRSLHPATGFALACQRDKGLPDDADYMALRREEDRAACRALGAEPVWLDLPEAPGRGYGSAASLFAEPLPGDGVAGTLAALLGELVAAMRPSLVLAPQGCGGHVDHLLVIEAVLAVWATLPDPPRLGHYRDTPYVIRDPAAAPDPRVAAAAPRAATIALDRRALDAKQAAVACYATQLGFQFGGAAPAADAIEALMRQEAGGEAGDAGGLAERLLLPASDGRGEASWPTGW